ncbi:outer membrane beta-barrel family protein [Fulvivirga ligni]|uniref:outer membrane beta-barrel family protein n=1 Tax=Fulvivirga ligni TaxID=2904246 RepID=UPI001F2BCEE5|nr:outer membrane beta-barrel family protein [Fulvivirga ligni]UII23699.1 TonB-dependent receptor family protein [Fulvivirga ligni]
MRTILTSIALIMCISVFGQQRGGMAAGGQELKGKVTGTLVDATTGEALSFASVVLRNPESNKDINGTISEEDGTFKLSNVPLGKYDLLISFVGYETITREVTLTPKSPDANLETVKLTGTSTELEEVVVKGEKELIENKIDKIVYNADRDVANAGGDASQVLRRAPLLNVDLEGNVSMRGSQNVKILINGKPSSMFASNPGEALKAIPADNIKSVEVITTPSAKYEGDGTAGIINIITKKGEAQGFTGNVDLTVGTRLNRGSGSITAGKGRFGFNANLSGFKQWPQEGKSYYFTEDYVNDQIQEEIGTNTSNRRGYFGNIGAFYDFNAYHSISTSLRLRTFSFDSDNKVEGMYDSLDDISRYQRNTDNENAFGGYEWSVDYVFKFPEQKGHELSVSYKLDKNTQDQDYRIVQYDPSLSTINTFERNEKNLNDGDNNEHAFQVDYTNPISDKFTLEAGAKGILRTVTSDFSYETYQESTGTFITDQSRSDYFDYGQDVLASYLSGNFKFGTKYGLLAGLRYEYTKIEGDFRDTPENAFSNDYDNFLPSVTLSRKIGKMNSLKASYSRRIQRPSLRFINPYEQINNNKNVSSGNPELHPELTDQYEIGYSAFVKKVSVNASVFYKKTTDVIESYLTKEDDIYRTRYLNIGENNSIGVNLFTSLNLFEIWTLRGGLNVYTYNAKGVINGQSVSNNAILWDGNLNSNISLGESWIIDMFGFYRPRRQTLQGYNPSFSIFSMGIKKKIWGDRGSIGINVTQPFTKYQNFGSEIKGDTYYQTSSYDVPFRSFGFNLSYKFGKLDFKQRQRRSRIDNNDQKEGGDNQGGGF